MTHSGALGWGSPAQTMWSEKGKGWFPKEHQAALEEGSVDAGQPGTREPTQMTGSFSDYGARVGCVRFSVLVSLQAGMGSRILELASPGTFMPFLMVQVGKLRPRESHSLLGQS